MNRFLLLLSTIFFLLTTVHAASSATSFCKCVCFNNSTIIALNPPKSSGTTSPRSLLLERASEGGSPPEHRLTCSSCNRAFCLSYKLPICKEAREEDVFATCFQRDSIKDEAVVIIFIFATTALLGWALLKPWVVKWAGVGMETIGRQGGREREARYAPLGGETQTESRDSGLEGERDG